MDAISLPLRRTDPRSEVMDAQVRGILMDTSASAQSPFAVWDISDQGLRLWVPSEIKRGTAIRATIARPFVVLLSAEVRWCRPAPLQGGFFIGVQILSNFSRLESLHSQMVAKQTRVDQSNPALLSEV